VLYGGSNVLAVVMSEEEDQSSVKVGVISLKSPDGTQEYQEVVQDRSWILCDSLKDLENACLGFRPFLRNSTQSCVTRVRRTEDTPRDRVLQNILASLHMNDSIRLTSALLIERFTVHKQFPTS
jgi:hypothetical protein